jgi:hypothetical protein
VAGEDVDALGDLADPHPVRAGAVGATSRGAVVGGVARRAAGPALAALKEQQLGLFADRTSTRTLRGNQLRLLAPGPLCSSASRGACCSTALHPAAARALRDCILEASERVQVIVTSHSADLLDDSTIDESLR